MPLQDLFEHYFPPKADPEATFTVAKVVFDTNVFLDLYRLGPIARSEVLAGLRQGVKGRLWIPDHVLLEVSKNRTSLVLEAADRQEENIANITSACEQAKAALESAAIAQSTPADVLSEALKELDDAFRKISSAVKDKEQSAKLNLDVDEVLQFINEVLESQKATAPVQDWYDKSAKEAADRSARKLPPGYKDERKDEVIRSSGGTLIAQKFGDFYIWKQLIEEVASRPTDFEHVVFVTSDRKEDWWEIVRGKAQGPRPELRLEIQEAGAKSFHMYQLTRLLEFLRAAQPKKGGAGVISEKTVADVREVEQTQGTIRSGGDSNLSFLQQFSRAGEEGFRGYHAQNAVEAWLREVFPNHTIIENSGFPDLVVRLDESTSHGFEVVTPRNPEQLRALIHGKAVLARAWLESLGGLLFGPERRKLTFVITLTSRALSGPLAESLWLTFAERIAQDLRAALEVNFLIGRIEDNEFRLVGELS